MYRLMCNKTSSKQLEKGINGKLQQFKIFLGNEIIILWDVNTIY